MKAAPRQLGAAFWGAFQLSSFLRWLLVRREILDEPFVAALHFGARALETRLVALEDQPGERPDVGER